jgi:hypothetical protein
LESNNSIKIEARFLINIKKQNAISKWKFNISYLQENKQIKEIRYSTRKYIKIQKAIIIYDKDVRRSLILLINYIFINIKYKMQIYRNYLKVIIF